jgi:hypothetical protein
MFLTYWIAFILFNLNFCFHIFNNIILALPYSFDQVRHLLCSARPVAIQTPTNPSVSDQDLQQVHLFLDSLLVIEVLKVQFELLTNKHGSTLKFLIPCPTSTSNLFLPSDSFLCTPHFTLFLIFFLKNITAMNSEEQSFQLSKVNFHCLFISLFMNCVTNICVCSNNYGILHIGQQLYLLAVGLLLWLQLILC